MFLQARDCGLLLICLHAIGTSTARPTPKFATVGCTPLHLGLGTWRMTPCKLKVVETVSELLNAVLPDILPVADKEMGMPNLLHDFEASVPSADTAHVRRHATCKVDTPQLGLKHLLLGARGLIVEEAESEEDMAHFLC